MRFWQSPEIMVLVRLFVLVIAATTIVGSACSGGTSVVSSAQPATTTSTVTRPAPLTASAIANGLCSLPTTSQLVALLGTSTTQRTPLPKPVTKPLDHVTKSAVACRLTADQQRLGLQVLSVSVLTYTVDPLLQGLDASIRAGGFGSCSRDLGRSDMGTVYDCTSSAKDAPDFSGAPELAVDAFLPRAAVHVLWTGAPGSALPRGLQARFSILRALCEQVVKQYGR
jgi:hypothetical protein